MPLGTFDFEKAGTMGYTRNMTRAASILEPRSAIGVAVGLWMVVSISGSATIATAQDIKPAAPAPAAKASKAPAAKAKSDGGSADAASAKANPEVALKAYSSGARAFESGKMTEAVNDLTTALSAGGLPSGQMAKALYYRGAAYRKQGKPAMAISDLTSALWLKGGLSDADRALATDARQSAYREAGLGDSAPAVPVQQSASAAGVPSAAAKSAPAPAAPAPASPPFASATAAPTPPSAAVEAVAAAPSPSSWQPATNSATASEPIATLGSVPEPPTTRVASVSAPTQAPPAATPEPSTVVASAEPSVPAANTAILNAVEPEGASVAPVSPLANAGKSVSGFFNNMGSSIGKMFDGGGSQPAAQATQTSSSPVMTSSTGPVYASTADTNAAASGWGDRVLVSPAGGKTVKIAAKSEPMVAKPSLAKGNILLQVAAVRSRDEAERVSNKLQGTAAVQSAAAGTLIDEAVIGNMGTFYRVRLGPFANAAEPGKLCAVLKPEGYDCLVVSQ